MWVFRPADPWAFSGQWRTLGGGGGGEEGRKPNNFSILFYFYFFFNQLKTFSIKNDCINTLFVLTQPKTTTLKVYQITTASLQ